MNISEKVKNLPRQPGVYIMRDETGAVIYVGKAKSLKNRVSQYFQSNARHTLKTATMVRNVADFEYIVAGTELEALILECNLIKEHMPKYNILLKDDKGYPYIKVTVNEDFPRISSARRVEHDGAKYYGPYLNNTVVNSVVDLIKKIFQIRNCNRNLPRDIGKERPCLNYSIKQCSAPCSGEISQEEYSAIFNDVCKFLSGKYEEITQRLETEMRELSSQLQFERAAKKRDKIQAITKIRDKQKVVSTDLDNKDIIALAKNGKDVCVQVFFVRGGKMLGRDNYFLKNLADEEDAKIIEDFMKQYYALNTQIPRRIIVGCETEDNDLLQEWLSSIAGTRISLSAPQKGVNMDLVKMAQDNALEALQLQQIDKNVFQKKADTLLFEVKELLNLDNAPITIEAYDISHTAGADTVGVCVVFQNATPLKKGYRKYNINTTEQSDDYGAIREVLTRRFAHSEEEYPLPDLMLIDGGKGHVSTAKAVAESNSIVIPIFGMVKDDKHRTRGITTESDEISVPITGRAFKFFTKIQDEVHRFAVKSHQNKHKNSTLASELMSIKGIGKARQSELLKVFGNIDKIKAASIEELAAVKGIDENTAKSIFTHFLQN